MNYFIKNDYICNIQEVPCDLSNQTKEQAMENQKYVYEIAKTLCKNNILDIGCGSGHKLIEIFEDKKTLGLEVEPNLEMCKKNYPHRKWQYANYTNTFEYFDTIICADVIEHVVDPDVIMSFIKNMNPQNIIMSTPDRNLVKIIVPVEWDIRNGPPFNKSHIREWTVDEFLNYFKSWFDSYNITYKNIIHTTIIIATK